MGRQEFSVAFNTDPARPVGVIDGFRQKGREKDKGLLRPSQMKDELDGRASIHIRGREYVVDETGSVVGAAVREEIDRHSSEGVSFEIGEGVFIAEGVRFDVDISRREAGYRMADGSAIGHHFQAEDLYLTMDMIGSLQNRLPVTDTSGAEAMVTASLQHKDIQQGLLLAPGLNVGKSAVLWCVASGNMTTVVSDYVTIGDEAQVFAAAIGRQTRIGAGTIVEPARGMVGSHMVLEPGGMSSAGMAPDIPC